MSTTPTVWDVIKMMWGKASRVVLAAITWTAASIVIGFRYGILPAIGVFLFFLFLCAVRLLYLHHTVKLTKALIKEIAEANQRAQKQ